MCGAFRRRTEQKSGKKGSIRRDAAMVFGGAVAGCVLSLSIVFSISERRIEPGRRMENYHFIADPNFPNIPLAQEDAGQSCDYSIDEIRTKLDNGLPMTVDPVLSNSSKTKKRE